MMKKFYLSASLQKHAQRFIRPIYYRDKDGGPYLFSSTLTLIKYNGAYWAVLANHALVEKGTLNELYFLLPSGVFIDLKSLFARVEFYPEDDVVIGIMGLHKDIALNYFDLDEIIEPKVLSMFYWFGFPASWGVKKYRSNISSDEMSEKYIQKSENYSYQMKNNKYRGCPVDVKPSQDPKKVLGHYINKDVEFEKKGFVTQGGALDGMSGGSFFHINSLSIAQHLPFEELGNNLEDFFEFVGIGLEYNHRTCEVRGLSRLRLQELLVFFMNKLEKDPVEFMDIDGSIY